MEELELADYIAILRRKKKIILIVALVLASVSFFKALTWSTYRSMAVVQIEQPEISAMATNPMGMSVESAMAAQADRSISEISEKITSTASLIEIITKFDLYANARKSRPVADVANDMRKKIKIELINGSVGNSSPIGRLPQSAIAFTIGFDYNDALLTQQVTDDLVTRFLDQDLKDRRAETQSTSEFLATQIATLEASLSEQEKKISEYQKKTGASRPDNLAFNQQAAASLNLSIQNINSQLASLDGSIGALRSQLAIVDPYSRVVADGQVLTTPSVQLKALQSQYASLSSRYGAEHPDVIKTKRQIEALQPQVHSDSKQASRLKAQIIDLRTNLGAAKNTYGEEHPDVIALQEQLKKAEDSLVLQKSGVSGTKNGITEDADNPAYLQLVAQLSSAETQRTSMAEELKHLKSQQEIYHNAVIDNPEVAQEMAALSRDYDNAQMRYRELKAKKMAADMEEQMQKDRKGRRLTLINPPELPLHTQPRRLLILIAGLFISVVSGLGAALVSHLLSQSVVGFRHLESLVGAPPLIAIPHIQTEEERRLSLQNRIQLLCAAAIEHIKRRIKAQTEGSNGQA